MRQISAAMKERLLSTQQTLYANANPWMEVRLLRQKLPIQDKKYWQESIVAPVDCTASSVAIRKQSVLRPPDIAYVAYVHNSTLYVKQAAIRYPISHMYWELVEEIPNVLACALDFDGMFKRTASPAVSEIIVEFETDETPYLFYLTTDNQLMYGLLGSEYEELAGNVETVDVIRGIASENEDVNQGLLVFYAVDGSVYYNSLIDGVWQGQQPVSIAPTDVVAIRATRTVDWRIVLHVTDSTGALYEVFTKPYVSGWAGRDYLTARALLDVSTMEVVYRDAQSDNEHVSVAADMAITILWGADQTIKVAENVDDGTGNFGYKVKLEWDYPISNVMEQTLAFTLEDSAEHVFTQTGIAQISDRVIEVTFKNFNNAVGECTVRYTPGTLLGEAGQLLGPASKTFMPVGLVPFEVIPPVPISIENTQDWSVD
jgi:hypothetical protein